MTWIDRRVSERMKSLAAFARSEAAMLVALAVIMAALVLFLDLAEDLGEASHNAFDLEVIQALHSGADPSNPIGPNWFDRAMLDLTSLGSLAVLGAVSLIVTGYLLFQRQSLKALALVLALGGGLVLSETLKSVFERSRPPEIYRAAEALNASFPSGHALLSTVVYLTLGAMLARAATRRRIKSYILGVAIVIALIVGASRVYLGLHWPSDVMAGWCLGAAWATACWLGERTLRARFVKPRALEEVEIDQLDMPQSLASSEPQANPTLH